MPTSPSPAHRGIQAIIERMKALGHDPEPLVVVQSTAYSSSLELLGDLGRALRQIERQRIVDPELEQAFAALWQQIHQVWPRL
jgi:hypothetical protein